MATPQQEAEAATVLDAYTQVSKNLRETVLAQILAAWDSLTAWRDTDISGFVSTVVPLVLAGQDHMSALTGAYLNRMVALQSPGAIKPVAVPTVDFSGAAVRNGATPTEVYSRSGPTVWRALQQGDDIEAAVSKARDRVSKMAQTDLQLARTHASRAVLSKSDRVLGYRRVLTGVSSCALCVVASTRRYSKSALLPIHPGCDCTVAPLMGTEALPDTLDKDVLDAAHQEIKARLGVDTNKASRLRELTIVHEHGEMGPLLAVRGQNFIGPSDI